MKTLIPYTMTRSLLLILLFGLFSCTSQNTGNTGKKVSARTFYYLGDWKLEKVEKWQKNSQGAQVKTAEQSHKQFGVYEKISFKTGLNYNKIKIEKDKATRVEGKFQVSKNNKGRLVIKLDDKARTTFLANYKSARLVRFEDRTDRYRRPYKRAYYYKRIIEKQ